MNQSIRSQIRQFTLQKIEEYRNSGTRPDVLDRLNPNGIPPDISDKDLQRIVELCDRDALARLFTPTA